MGAGVTWIQGNPSAFENWGKTTLDKIKADAAAAVAEIAPEAAAKMREFISSRGLPNSKGSGRIDTGEMLNAVDSEFEFNGDMVTGTFGWTGGGEIYFLAQEEGAVLWNGGVIAPMLALYDAGQWAEEELIKRIKDLLKAG